MLVSAEWLAQQFVLRITSNPVSDKPRVHIIDASWHLPSAGRNAREEFEQQHIPGAIFWDIDEIAAESKIGDEKLPHMLPTPKQFATALAERGIYEGDSIVIYDQTSLFMASTRLWWTFMALSSDHPRVSILNGGLAQWRQYGFATENGPAAQAVLRPTRTPWPVVQYPKFVTNKQDLLHLFDSRQHHKFTILDARPLGRYRGKDPEPRPARHRGHISGALSLPFIRLFKTQSEVDTEANILDENDDSVSRNSAPFRLPPSHHQSQQHQPHRQQQHSSRAVSVAAPQASQTHVPIRIPNRHQLLMNFDHTNNTNTTANNNTNTTTANNNTNTNINNNNNNNNDQSDDHDSYNEDDTVVHSSSFSYSSYANSLCDTDSKIRNSPSLSSQGFVSSGLMRSTDQLSQIFAECKIEPSRPIIVYCGSGVTAASVFFALTLCGHTHLSLYDGSWAEWGNADDTALLVRADSSDDED